MAKSEEPRPIPPYLPFETFVNAISHFKATAVPGRIDKSAFQSDMHRLQRGQVQSALRYLGLIDDSDITRQELNSLVAAHGTKDWGEALSKYVFPKYAQLIGDLDTNNATQKQLDERFQKAGLAGQMLVKAIRFYLALMNAAGVPFSPHLVARRTSGNGATKKKSPRKAASSKTVAEPGSPVTESSPLKSGGASTAGLVEFPIPIGDTQACIRVPKDITPKQMPLVQAIVAAVDALAKQNGGD